ncbi:unnamed protein product [Toxocara canis]|uniref:Transposase n=1 Tax=Toxocara canis TaxID=6265 RepID=A0A183UF57_TOXCA|nr:unnamed protein product [Toxocara canis]
MLTNHAWVKDGSSRLGQPFAEALIGERLKATPQWPRGKGNKQNSEGGGDARSHDDKRDGHTLRLSSFA